MKRMDTRLQAFCLTCVMITVPTTLILAQFDSANVRLGLFLTSASKQYQPFWNTMKRFGTISDYQTDITSFVRASNQHVLSRVESLDEDLMVAYRDLSLEYGVSVYNNSQFDHTFIQEGYVRFSYGSMALTAGRYEEILNDDNENISSGSLGVSGNSIPIPKVSFAVSDYSNLNFTGGWVSAKGSIGHGWFGKNRYMKDGYYHEKSLYLRVGQGDLKFYGGFQHYAEWGGRRTGLAIVDQSLNGFMSVLLVRKNKDEVRDSAEADGRISKVADHRGLIELGTYYNNEFFEYQGYIQMATEDRKLIGGKNKGILFGFAIKPKDEESILKNALVEVIYSRKKEPFISYEKSSSLYNNGDFKTGWEYEGKVIGNPLFLNRKAAHNYYPEINAYNWDTLSNDIPPNSNIISNELFAFHAGAGYDLGTLKGKVLLTYVQYFGDLKFNSPFAPSKTQIYTLNEFSYEVPAYNLNLKVGLGIDFGELSGNVGGLFGLEWKVPVGKNKPAFESY